MKRISVAGSTRPAKVDDQDFDLVSRFKWQASYMPDGTIHAMTIINGGGVLMEDLVVWAALTQGMTVGEDGMLVGKIKPIPGYRLKEQLESLLEKQSLDLALNDLIAGNSITAN